jgi:hypothetical protein
MGWGKEEKKELAEPSTTERDVLVYEINEISNETLESTRNMRRMCEESKDMGQKTMGLLDNQGESIENWDEVADGINRDMALAEKALKAMDRACFGFIPRFWKVYIVCGVSPSRHQSRSVAASRRTTRCGRIRSNLKLSSCRS